MEQAQGILEGLDERQRTAATTLQGPVRIIAGAGAGKTRTVTRRIAYACATGAWKPERVLAVTFSVKAAAEMRARLGQLGVGGGTGRSGLGAGTAGVTAATFHSAALHQLNSVWADICEAPFPHVIEDQRDVVSRAIIRATARTDADPLTVRDVLAEINWAKISLVAVEDYARACAIAHRQPPAGLDTARFADVYSAYEQEKTSRGEIDFDDILLLVCHIMDGFPEAAAQIRSTIGWLTVDEYQDVSPLQHRLLTLWLGGGGPDGKSAMNRNVCVVGDPAQTIYSFAGASSWDLLRFADEFGPLAADVNLNTDYRSTPEVVNLANRVLAAAPNREDYLKLVSARESGPRVTRTAYESDMEEAQGVAARIARLVANGAKPSDPHPHQRPTAGIRCRLARCETEISRPQGFGMAIIRARRRCRVQTRTIGGDGFGRHRTCRKRRSRGYDFHDPRIQGSGIQARVSDRLFGRALAVWFAGNGGCAGRGTPAYVCGHHPS